MLFVTSRTFTPDLGVVSIDYILGTGIAIYTFYSFSSIKNRQEDRLSTGIIITSSS